MYWHLAPHPMLVGGKGNPPGRAKVTAAAKNDRTGHGGDFPLGVAPDPDGGLDPYFEPPPRKR